MSEARADAPGSLWSFAASLYSVSGVKEACLALQTQYQADIPFLLFGGWLGSDKNVVLRPEDAQLAHARIRHWHVNVVRGLRTVRQYLKAESGPLPQSAQPLRLKVAEVELEAERIELQVLEAAGQELCSSAERSLSSDVVIQNLRTALAIFASEEECVEAQGLLEAIAIGEHQRRSLVKMNG